MGCCFSEPVDFDGEVSLYHFDLHRAVGKGAFGKVRPHCYQYWPRYHWFSLIRCGSSNISVLKSSMPSSTSTRLAVSAKKQSATSYRREDSWKRFVPHHTHPYAMQTPLSLPDWPHIHCKFTICLSRWRELFLCTGPHAWRRPPL